MQAGTPVKNLCYHSWYSIIFCSQYPLLLNHFIFQNQDRKHRTYVYVLVITEVLEDWEDSVNIGKMKLSTLHYILSGDFKCFVNFMIHVHYHWEVSHAWSAVRYNWPMFSTWVQHNSNQKWKDCEWIVSVWFCINTNWHNAAGIALCNVIWLNWTSQHTIGKLLPASGENSSWQIF